MPKIIKNLEIKILKNALKLFSESNYNSVSMSGIAEESGIAVGTLYNYYPNKKKLFIEAFNMSWDETFVKIDRIMKDEGSYRHKLNRFIEVLYTEIDKRKGLGKELIKLNVFEIENKSKENSLSRIKREIYLRIDSIITDLRDDEGISISEEHEFRFKKNLVYYIIDAINVMPEDKEANIDYLKYVVNSVLN